MINNSPQFIITLKTDYITIFLVFNRFRRPSSPEDPGTFY